MKREQILECIKSLAKSQGYYGRLLEQINSVTDEQRENIWQTLEDQNFKDTLDFVMWIET